MATAERAMKIRVLRPGIVNGPAPDVAIAIAHVKTRMTVVRRAVARFELMFSTPTFARTAVIPAKNAEAKAHQNQFTIAPISPRQAARQAQKSAGARTRQRQPRR